MLNPRPYLFARRLRGGPDCGVAFAAHAIEAMGRKAAEGRLGGDGGLLLDAADRSAASWGGAGTGQEPAIKPREAPGGERSCTERGARRERVGLNAAGPVPDVHSTEALLGWPSTSDADLARQKNPYCLSHPSRDHISAQEPTGPASMPTTASLASKPNSTAMRSMTRQKPRSVSQKLIRPRLPMRSNRTSSNVNLFIFLQVIELTSLAGISWRKISSRRMKVPRLNSTCGMGQSKNGWRRS